MYMKGSITRNKLSPLNAWAFSFACMIGWAAFVMPATTFLPVGGVMGSARLLNEEDMLAIFKASM